MVHRDNHEATFSGLAGQPLTDLADTAATFDVNAFIAAGAAPSNLPAVVESGNSLSFIEAITPDPTIKLRPLYEEASLLLAEHGMPGTVNGQEAVISTVSSIYTPPRDDIPEQVVRLAYIGPLKGSGKPREIQFVFSLPEDEPVLNDGKLHVVTSGAHAGAFSLIPHGDKLELMACGGEEFADSVPGDIATAESILDSEWNPMDLRIEDAKPLPIRKLIAAGSILVAALTSAVIDLNRDIFTPERTPTGKATLQDIALLPPKTCVAEYDTTFTNVTINGDKQPDMNMETDVCMNANALPPIKSTPAHSFTIQVLPSKP